MDPNLRTATDSDLEFLLDLRRRALGEYVIETWGRWDDARQRDYLIERLEQSLIQIVQCDGSDVGMFSVEERPDEVFLENVVLLPDWQNRGIGTRLVTGLQEKAREKGRPVRLEVLRVNPARRLYERLGFRVIQKTDVMFEMEWKG